MNSLPLMAVTSLALLVAGCGGGSGGGTSTGSFSLGVSDNPANVQEVTIGFRQVVLKSVTDGDQVFSFEVAEAGEIEQIDLLQFTGSQVESLVANQQVPVGDYQLCIYIHNGGVANPQSRSFVRTNDNSIVGLTTPSNGSCGGVGANEADTGRIFFNQPFTISAGNNNLVAEFNLERGLLSPRGSSPLWTIKPTAVQLVNSEEVGTISGQVSAAVLTDCALLASPSAVINKVYLYPGVAEVVDNDPSVPNMVDFRGDAPVGADEVEPIAAAEVEADTLQYELAFVPPGTYSVGFTCVAQNDDPNAADSEATPFFLTEDAQGIVVESNTTTVQDLPAS